MSMMYASDWLGERAPAQLAISTRRREVRKSMIAKVSRQGNRQMDNQDPYVGHNNSLPVCILVSSLLWLQFKGYKKKMMMLTSRRRRSVLACCKSQVLVPIYYGFAVKMNFIHKMSTYFISCLFPTKERSS